MPAQKHHHRARAAEIEIVECLEVGLVAVRGHLDNQRVALVVGRHLVELVLRAELARQQHASDEAAHREPAGHRLA